MSERVTQGDQGEWVEYLQNVMHSKGIDPGAIDGVFGEKLVAKVREYQTDQGLVADGVVDTKTWGSLLEEKAASESVPIDWSQLPLLSTLAQYSADENGAKQFLRDYGIDIDLLTAEA